VAAHARNVTNEVILFDNGSTDGSVEAAKRDLSDLRVIQSAENLGFSAANNAAAQSASGEYLLFLNTDTLLTGDALLPMVEYLDAHSGVGAVGPRLLYEDGQFQFSAGRLPSIGVEFQQKMMHALTRRWRKAFTPLFSRLFRGIRDTGWVTGACLMVRREAFRHVGGFDGEMFMYFEDKDLCKRMAAAGWRIVYFPPVSVIHLLAGSSRNVGKSRIDGIYRASQRRYYLKHHGGFQNLLLKTWQRMSGKV
jgi:GT2 family glycosyltransferase